VPTRARALTYAPVETSLSTDAVEAGEPTEGFALDEDLLCARRRPRRPRRGAAPRSVGATPPRGSTRALRGEEALRLALTFRAAEPSGRRERDVLGGIGGLGAPAVADGRVAGSTFGRPRRRGRADEALRAVRGVSAGTPAAGELSGVGGLARRLRRPRRRRASPSRRALRGGGRGSRCRAVVFARVMNRDNWR
jgi:hypothetical protein